MLSSQMELQYNYSLGLIYQERGSSPEISGRRQKACQGET